MKKICILTTVHSAFDDRIFHKEAKSIAKNGYQVVLIAPHSKKEFVDGVTIIPLKVRNSRLARLIFTNIELLKKSVKEKAAVYHFHDPEIIPVGLFLKILKKKVVYDIHEDVPKDVMEKDWIPLKLRMIISKLINWLEKYAGRKFDGMLGATPHICSRFGSSDIKNVMSVCNFPMLEEFKVYINKIDLKRVCYVGGIAETRGIREMIESISLTKLQLSIAGSYQPFDLKNNLINMAGWSQVEDRGYLNRPDVAELLESSLAGLVLLHPIDSYKYAFPIKLFEYMAAGIPFIASDFPVWRDLVKDVNCGLFVNPMNKYEIAQAIQYLSENPNIAYEMGKRGRKLVEEKYNWGNEEKKILDLYAHLLNN